MGFCFLFPLLQRIKREMDVYDDSKYKFSQMCDLSSPEVGNWVLWSADASVADLCDEDSGTEQGWAGG